MGHYASFLVFALALALVPGPDMLLTMRSTVVGGRRRGLWTLLGIGVANVVQGVLAGSGLGAIIQASQPAFEVIRWVGVAYLVYLGIRALVAAFRGDGTATAVGDAGTGRRWSAARTGFLCNITNPKVLAFNLAVLPQFVGPHARVPQLMLYALTLTVVGVAVLLGVVAAAGAARRLLTSRRARRRIEGAAGVVFLGFATGLAAEH